MIVVPVWSMMTSKDYRLAVSETKNEIITLWSLKNVRLVKSF